ncbi:hypothetical protein [Balneola sp. MJW-20]|uniref:hypothetical protein n=1 Tax=Gracilimonas aurantiaca TaxID=3234185 RepID=UPI00390CA084
MATRITGLILTIVTIGTIIIVHAQFGWSSINMGNNGGRDMEFQVLIIAMSVLYSIRGNYLNKSILTDQTN